MKSGVSNIWTRSVPELPAVLFPQSAPPAGRRRHPGFGVELTDGSFRLILASGFHVKLDSYHFHDTGITLRRSEVRHISVCHAPFPTG